MNNGHATKRKKMDENDGKPDTLTAALYMIIFITYRYFIIIYFIISKHFTLMHTSKAIDNTVYQ
jgi:hypothetical protein